MTGPAERPASGVETLYPFLYAGATDDATHGNGVDAAVRGSMLDKIDEVGRLRAAFVEEQGEALAACARALAAAFAGGARLLTFGNGGSSTDAQAIATTFAHPGGDARPLPAVALTNNIAELTALANDVGYDVVFARQLAALSRPGDIAMGLSTSGGSRNVLAAFEQAHRLGMHSVGFAGYDGGSMAELATLEFLFVVRSASVHRIQEVQTTAYHLLWELIQGELSPAT